MTDHPFVTIIGRGHSGTRAMSHTLTASGVFMGAPLNPMGDLLPPEDMYTACCVLAGYVQWLGGLEWDWSALHAMGVRFAIEDFGMDCVSLSHLKSLPFHP